MNSNEFWCRAFLAAMGGQYVDNEDGGRWENHGAPAAYSERAADAALAVAQRRGMVTGERPGSRPVTQAGVAQTVSDYLSRSAPIERPAPGPVGFTAERDGDMWTLRGRELHGSIAVHSEQLTYPLAGGVVAHITWSEVNGRPTPIEVRIVGGGAR